MFDHIFNWRLLAGSHVFPGPDGGTCINEAAIVAAGFPYRKISSAQNCPPCFSRPIAAYAIAVNDRLLGSQDFSEEEKQQIMKPFVLRLAGTADTPEIENQRYDYLIIGIIRKCMPIVLRGWKDGLATQAAAVNSLEDVRQFALDRAHALDLDHALALALARALARALDRALALALDLDRALARRREVLLAMVRLLDGVLEIGRQADPLDGALIRERLDAARALAPV